MKKISSVISLFVLAFCLVSCVETVPLKDLGIKPKLVLYCFLSPQYDEITVSLTTSQPFFSSGKDVSAVESAIVEISNDNANWVQIPYDRFYERYLLPHALFPVVEGQTYYIRASAPNFESISASCTVPFWRETDLKPEVEFVPRLKNENVPYTLLYFSWEDYRGEENYYSFINYEVQMDFNIIYLPGGELTYDTTVNLYSYYAVFGKNSEVVFSNEGNDGMRMKALWTELYNCTSSDFMSGDYWSWYGDFDSVYIIFAQTDRNVFLYENSAMAASEGGFFSIFMIEPTLVYSNIKNGYGVFGAMTFKPYLLNFRQKTIEEAEYPKNEQSRIRR
jgi:hypothetical protein